LRRMPRLYAATTFPTADARVASGASATWTTRPDAAWRCVSAGRTAVQALQAIGPNMLRSLLCCAFAIGGCFTDDRQLLRNIMSARCGRLRDVPRRLRAGAPP